ncbi:MAG TPA: VPLPA-CTERM sorting domain-containing protein [Candidatus Competibacteraceae bacterium]|nr:VPLPA-CTERM sorting domain-containing protein [Candidatus Competibacteraceae bacterium]HRZ07945.1 VPLPA-CTERM sorting domain-containing protein [Candidatus Competibacteraceae bacterium]HSA48184.1 VPLPA-CTERM sorting domain-containing protein [Candidatus Competibacteraceae bacterium]
MFKQNLLSAAVLAACLGVAAPAAHANTITIPLIDFDRFTACAFTCQDGSVIKTDYGSVPVLSLSWGSTDGQNQATVTGTANWYNQYGGLPEVAYGQAPVGSGSSLQVVMTALAGYSLASLSFDYAGWQNQGIATQYGIYQADGTTPITGPITNLTAPGQNFATAAYTFAGSETAAVLRFGPNGFDAGIDNLNITLTTPTGPGTGQIPEPASLALLGVGLAGLGFMRRRRT